MVRAMSRRGLRSDGGRGGQGGSGRMRGLILAGLGMLALAYNQIKVLDLERLRQFGLDQI